MKLFGQKTAEDGKLESHSVQTDDSLNELRKLLVGPLQSELEEIQEMLKDQGLHPEEVSKILPEAILIRSSRDSQIVTAMEPITEEAIKSSVTKDPRVLVEVLVPVMLPAIKKAITTLIKEMIQSFSATLEHGLSMRGLKWRFEAFKTKKPFGEIALIHSLIYQVEQIFLIHKETGLVLQHLVSDDTVAQDPDMVSGMLTAIQDFVRDSFGGSQDDSLENLQFGDRLVLINQTSQLVLAAVVWGTPPVDLEGTLYEVLRAIHFEHLDELRSFDGNTAPFERSKGRLADCLKNQFKPKKRHPFIAWSLMALVVFLVGYGSFFLIRDYVRWQDYLERLHEEPGIVITEAGRKSSQYYVFGLRDPLSVDPETLLDASKLEREKVRFNWELYHSSHLMFVIRRIQTILTPPETITLEMKGQGILCAKGSATYEWLANAEKLAEAIPGILRFQSDEVSVIDQRDMELLSEKVEGGFFFFDKVAAKIKPGQEYRVEALANDIKEMDRLAQIFDKDIQIEIVGHTDSTGTDERNLQISKERAEELFSLLVSSGNRQEIFIVRGAGSKEPLREELSEEDRNFNRSVSFSVTIRDKVSDENGDTDEATAPAELAIPEISDKNGDTNEAAAPPAERGIPEEPAPDPPPATKPDGAEFGPL